MTIASSTSKLRCESTCYRAGGQNSRTKNKLNSVPIITITNTRAAPYSTNRVHCQFSF